MNISGFFPGNAKNEITFSLMAFYIAGSFRVSLFIERWGATDLGKGSGFFLIIRWPRS